MSNILHNRLIEYGCLMLFFCLFSCTRTEVHKKIDKDQFVNQSFYNAKMSKIFADTINLRGKNIYSVRHYKQANDNTDSSEIKILDNKAFVLDSYAEYLPDGRRRYQELQPSSIISHTKYHYDSTFQRLLLEENFYRAGGSLCHWKLYDTVHALVGTFSYSTSPYGRPFDLLFYKNYNRVALSNGETQIEVIVYDSDTLFQKKENYVFLYPYMTESICGYETRDMVYELIDGQMTLVAKNGYVFDNRNVTYAYDDEGYVTSEIWFSDGQLQNKTEYTYSSDHRERVEQQYHMLGTEKSTMTTRKYDEYNNIIFEQSIEYTGNPLSITLYEYVYDDRGNWTDKRKYNQPCDNWVLGEKKLIGQEKREIVYYQANQKPREFSLPSLPEEFEYITTQFPKIAGDKDKIREEYDRAISNHWYADSIELQIADNLSDFTPKYWTVSDTAYGDLDGIEGDEAVVVYRVPSQAKSGDDHCLAIFKKEGKQWKLWHQTFYPILDSGSGGMFGNPFRGVDIQKRCIVIHHFGGSRQKWEYTHRYRFQNNDWYLIGATSSFGASCDYWESIDYNLSTGKAIYEHTREDCTGDEDSEMTSSKIEVYHKIPLPLMDEFEVGKNLIKINENTDFYY